MSSTYMESSTNGSPQTKSPTEYQPIAPGLVASLSRMDDKAWQKFVKNAKKTATSWSQLFSPEALCWGLGRRRIATLGLVRSLMAKDDSTRDSAATREREAQKWIESLTARKADFHLALEALAWGQALPRLTRKLERSTWSTLCGAIVDLVDRGLTGTLRKEMGELPSVLVAAELALTLVYVLPELSQLSSLRHAGRHAFHEAMDILLDGEGTPHADGISDIQLLLATSVRIIAIDKELKKGSISKDAKLQMDWLTRQTLRWSRPDGGGMLSADDSPYFDELMTTAARFTGDKADLMALKVLRGKRKSTPTTSAETPEWSEHSEWSEVAVMRTEWGPDQSQVGIAYANRQFRWEVVAQAHVLLSGISQLHLEVDHQELHVASDWSEICWETNDDADYMELELEFNKGWKVQRQVLLAREDQFLYVADAVLGPPPGEEVPHILYRHTLPIDARIQAESMDETTEVFFKAGTRRIATLVPLACCEWRTDTRAGKFGPQEGTLTMSRSGRALYAPLFIDLHPRRQKKQLTWRQLTVAENLQIMSADSAVAYRMQVAKEQWIFYRSLIGPGNRTFLGVNTVSEFVAATFDTDGQVESLIDISGELEE